MQEMEMKNSILTQVLDQSARARCKFNLKTQTIFGFDFVF